MRLLYLVLARDLEQTRQTEVAVTPAIIESALRAIARLCTEPDCHLRAVAQRLHMSPFYLDRMLKRHTGMTFTQHMRTLRVERAEQLLRHTDRPIKQIAAATGFRHVSTLDRAFHRVLYQSPTQYRLAHKACAPAGR